MNMTLKANEFNTHLEPLPPQDDTVHPLIVARHSHGSFTDDQIDWDTVAGLIQAARYAPSSYNTQPWRFVVIRQGPGREIIDQDLVEWGAAWATKAPVLLAVIVAIEEGATLHDLNYAPFDCGMAVQNILLQAASMGLAAHPVGFQNRQRVEQVLHLPETHRLLLFIALGYPGQESIQTNAERRRKPVSAIATWDMWDGAPVME